MNGLVIGGIALAVGGAAWALTRQADNAPWYCMAQDRAAVIKCYDSAAGKPSNISATSQVALDIMFSALGMAPDQPTAGLSDDLNARYLSVLELGPTPADYPTAVDTLDALWQFGALYEASMVASAIASRWGVQ